MVAAPKRHYITPEEYLQREQNAEIKSEYEDGAIVAMSGSSPEHALITFNFGQALGPFLRAKGCRGYSTDLRVRVEAVNKYYYPDMAVVCGASVYEERVKGMKCLCNPFMIVEVLSSSTEKRDKGDKWFAYQTLAALESFVLIHQDTPRVEVYSRGPEDRDAWSYHLTESIEKQVVLMGESIELSAIYLDVEFPEPSDLDANPTEDV